MIIPIILITLGVIFLILSAMAYDDCEPEASGGYLIIGILCIIVGICVIFLCGKEDNKTPVPATSIQTNVVQAVAITNPTLTTVITTNCETLLSKDGTIRVDIYTVKTNTVATFPTLKLEKE